MARPKDSSVAHAAAAADLLPLPTATFHILVALSEADRHGYAIMQEVAERTDGKTRLNPGTLYTTIRRLLDQGVILELDDRPDPDEDDERRRYYRLTPFGRQVAQLELARLGDLVAMAKHAGLAPVRS
jgi:DNA-binding PadR family transcriptional regulator